jgi:hypothetical protein
LLENPYTLGTKNGKLETYGGILAIDPKQKAVVMNGFSEMERFKFA